MKPSDYDDREAWWWAAINSHVNHKAFSAVDKAKTAYRRDVNMDFWSIKVICADRVDSLMDAWGEGR